MKRWQGAAALIALPSVNVTGPQPFRSSAASFSFYSLGQYGADIAHPPPTDLNEKPALAVPWLQSRMVGNRTTVLLLFPR